MAYPLLPTPFCGTLKIGNHVVTHSNSFASYVGVGTKNQKNKNKHDDASLPLEGGATRPPAAAVRCASPVLAAAASKAIIAVHGLRHTVYVHALSFKAPQRMICIAVFFVWVIWGLFCEVFKIRSVFLSCVCLNWNGVLGRGCDNAKLSEEKRFFTEWGPVIQ